VEKWTKSVAPLSLGDVSKRYFELKALFFIKYQSGVSVPLRNPSLYARKKDRKSCYTLSYSPEEVKGYYYKKA
jgi:hypothetical protein